MGKASPRREHKMKTRYDSFLCDGNISPHSKLCLLNLQRLVFLAVGLGDKTNPAHNELAKTLCKTMKLLCIAFCQHASQVVFGMTFLIVFHSFVSFHVTQQGGRWSNSLARNEKLKMRICERHEFWVSKGIPIAHNQGTIPSLLEECTLLAHGRVKLTKKNKEREWGYY